MLGRGETRIDPAPPLNLDQFADLPVEAIDGWIFGTRIMQTQAQELAHRIRDPKLRVLALENAWQFERNLDDLLDLHLRRCPHHAD